MIELFAALHKTVVYINLYKVIDTLKCGSTYNPCNASSVEFDRSGSSIYHLFQVV